MAPRPLTDRQADIIERLTRPGATQQTVADELGISVSTVKNHLTMAYRTLGVRKDQPVPLVRLTVTADGDGPTVIWIRPLEARAIGLDLIGAAHSAISDAGVRIMAKRHGLDGDGLIEIQRQMTTAELGPG